MLECKEKCEDPESDFYSMPSPKQQRKSRKFEKKTLPQLVSFLYFESSV